MANFTLVLFFILVSIKCSVTFLEASIMMLHDALQEKNPKKNSIESNFIHLALSDSTGNEY